MATAKQGDGQNGNGMESGAKHWRSVATTGTGTERHSTDLLRHCKGGKASLCVGGDVRGNGVAWSGRRSVGKAQHAIAMVMRIRE